MGQKDNSWVTPQLMQALQSRPDLTKGLSNPRIQEAMQLMQTDPTAAKKKYENDPEVTSFLMQFSQIMATHFEVLEKEKGKTSAPAGKTSAPASPAMFTEGGGSTSSSARPIAGGYSNSGNTSPEMTLMQDPAIQAAFKDPEVQRLLGELRAGRHLEIH